MGKNVDAAQELPPDHPFRGALPRIEPSADTLEHTLAAGRHDLIELGRRTAEQPASESGPLAERSVPLTLTFAHDDESTDYEADVLWGCRDWYCGQPFAIELACRGFLSHRSLLASTRTSGHCS